MAPASPDTLPPVRVRASPTFRIGGGPNNSFAAASNPLSPPSPDDDAAGALHLQQELLAGPAGRRARAMHAWKRRLNMLDVELPRSTSLPQLGPGGRATTTSIASSPSAALSPAHSMSGSPPPPHRSPKPLKRAHTHRLLPKAGSQPVRPDAASLHDRLCRMRVDAAHSKLPIFLAQQSDAEPAAKGTPSSNKKPGAAAKKKKWQGRAARAGGRVASSTKSGSASSAELYRAFTLSRDAAAAFFAADVNGDQKLSLDEFTQLVASLNSGPMGTAIGGELSEQTIMQLFKTCDADNSGEITTDEFFVFTMRVIEEHTGSGASHVHARARL